MAGQSSAAGLHPDAPAGDDSDAGYGCDTDRDAQARRFALLQGVQGLSAAELLVVRTRCDAVLGVPGWECSGRARATAGAASLSGASAGERDEGFITLRYGGLPGGVAAVLRRRDGPALRGDRLRDWCRRDRGVPRRRAGDSRERMETADPDVRRQAARDGPGMGGGLLCAQLGGI